MSLLFSIKPVFACWRSAERRRKLISDRCVAIGEIDRFPLHVQRDLLTIGALRIHQSNECTASKTFD
ncbi:hypothetical protein ACSV9I_02765 [Rhizobium sp. G187]|uniref:hypothetical protein n=1 Tax=Rhizobium sp. G187 TaxID=3451352 RepID=UPI003EE65F8C